ncbi:hypothetical protein [Alkalicoccus daliensis]|uniref:Uncharacterized protein n=1 Tax=Alkalicoccus daliensis TaxID=745820 RepID=A0A1H0GUL6_9BACI|nr:hypothetical protein [Alkalicoccus daliensis]SDO10575.1 hypothetical protein SAMN04488053_10740 [Alkalicoccus daliensis]
MKQLLLFITLAIIAAGCGTNNEETTGYDPEDYSIELTSTSGEEVEVFTEDRADIYFYFTGST